MGYKKLGYPTLLLANDIVQFVAHSLEWLEVQSDKAIEEARQGRLVFAVFSEQPHGHVACVYPGAEPVASKKWRLQRLPQVANIGKDVGVMGVNFAFREPPRYFVCNVV